MDQQKAIREVAKGFAGLVNRMDKEYKVKSYGDKGLEPKFILNNKMTIQKNKKNY